jgi:hypothetical protein
MLDGMDEALKLWAASIDFFTHSFGALVFFLVLDYT